MPVSKTLVPCELSVTVLICDSCQTTLYAPVNPWTTLAEMRIARSQGLAKDAASMRFEVVPQPPEQQVIELAMRQGWRLATWCGRRRIVCAACAKQEERESSPVRQN